MFKIIVNLNSFESIYITKNYIFLKKILNFIFSQKINKLNKKKEIFLKFPHKLSLKNYLHYFKYKNNFVYKKKILKKLNFVKNYGSIKKQKLFTVNCSPHIDKKSREQFFLTIYKKKLYIYNLTIKQVIIFLFLVKNSMLYGIQIKICLNLNTFYIK